MHQDRATASASLNRNEVGFRGERSGHALQNDTRSLKVNILWVCMAQTRCRVPFVLHATPPPAHQTIEMPPVRRLRATSTVSSDMEMAASFVALLMTGV